MWDRGKKSTLGCLESVWGVCTICMRSVCSFLAHSYFFLLWKPRIKFKWGQWCKARLQRLHLKSWQHEEKCLGQARREKFQVGVEDWWAAAEGRRKYDKVYRRCVRACKHQDDRRVNQCLENHVCPRVPCRAHRGAPVKGSSESSGQRNLSQGELLWSISFPEGWNILRCTGLHKSLCWHQWNGTV